MTKVRDLIKSAMQDAGVLGLGQEISAEDYRSAMTRLNLLLNEWRSQKTMVYTMVNKEITSNGETAYTIGPTGDITVTVRPSKIYSAFFQRASGSGDFSTDFSSDFEVFGRQTGNLDIPLKIITSRENYNELSYKRQSGDPGYLYYAPTVPNGTFYLNPVPPANSVSIVVSVLEPLQVLTNLNTDIALPPEYESALHYTMAERIAVAQGRPIPAEVKILARNARGIVRRNNIQVPVLTMPENLPVRTNTMQEIE
jgi:hypothetical protein